MADRPRPDTRALSVSELIAFGRDREAVEAATIGSRTPDGVRQLDQIVPLLVAVVDGIAPDQLPNTTPCATFTVDGVLEHMIGGAVAFAPAFRGDAPTTVAVEVGAAMPGESTTSRWHDAMAELLDAVHADGAQARTIASPFGAVPGSTFARYVAFDGLVHGWDLATATGQHYHPPAELVAQIDEFARGLITDEMRDGDTFAAAADPPADASPIERLAAFSGRHVPNKERYP